MAKRKDFEVEIAVASRKLLCKATIGELHEKVRAIGAKATAESLMCASVPHGIRSAVVRSVAKLLDRYA